MENLPPISSQVWENVISAFQGMIILVGAIVALRNLKVISKAHKINAIDKFTEDLSRVENDRQYLYQEFQFDEKQTVLKDKDQRVNNIINSLNRISLLIDNKLLSAEVVFALCHTMIIRCEFKLRQYIEFQESQIGGRYGRRVLRLARKAKLYHDSHPHQRANVIKLYTGKESIVIYKTEMQTGFLTKKAQLFEWWLRRRFGWYGK